MDDQWRHHHIGGRNADDYLLGDFSDICDVVGDCDDRERLFQFEFNNCASASLVCRA